MKFTAALYAFVATLFIGTTVLAHAGHEAPGSAPKGPFKVVKREDVWLSCAGSKNHTKFRAPFERVVLHQQSGYKVDYNVLLGSDVKTIAVGDILTSPKLVIEKCDKPFKIRCDLRGQPVALQYTGSQQDIYCTGRFNFVIEFQKDVGATNATPATTITPEAPGALEAPESHEAH